MLYPHMADEHCCALYGALLHSIMLYAFEITIWIGEIFNVIIW